MLYTTKIITVVDNPITAENHRTLRNKLALSRKSLIKNTTFTSSRLSKLERGRIYWTPSLSQQYCEGLLSVFLEKYTQKIDALENKLLELENVKEKCYE